MICKLMQHLGCVSLQSTSSNCTLCEGMAFIGFSPHLISISMSYQSPLLSHCLLMGIHKLHSSHWTQKKIKIISFSICFFFFPQGQLFFCFALFLKIKVENKFPTKHCAHMKTSRGSHLSWPSEVLIKFWTCGDGITDFILHYGL